MKRILNLGLLVAMSALAVNAPAAKKLVMIAGTPSHGPGDHEFNAGCLLLQKCLRDFPDLEVVVCRNGWPKNDTILRDADGIFIFSDGGGGHLALKPERLKLLSELMAKGVGLGIAHFAVEVPKDNGGPQWLAWIGGYYEDRFSCNPMWSPEFKSFPDHPVTRGVQPFSLRDEWYFNMRFRPDMQGVTPLLVAPPSDQVRQGPYVYPPGPYEHIVAARGRPEVLMWAVERADGGRGFGFTGGHYHRNWAQEDYRKVVLNALVWLVKLDVPAQGVVSKVTPEDLALNLDPKRR